ncbi:MAG: RNA polymerase factor sigma-54, partial [Planctomycetota bacterium]
MTPSMAKLGLKTHLRQGMQQRQEMTLAPRMLQSIEILTLPRADLDGWLAEEAQKNEALLVGNLSTGERLAPSRSSAARAKATDDHYALLQAQPDRAPSLAEAVEAQLRGRADLAPDLAEWVSFLAGCLDDGGLLLLEDDELVELAVQAELPMAGVEAGGRLLADAIAALQQLEPAGIGARSSVEALLLQLDPADPDYGLLCSLLEDFLVELSRNKRPLVAEKLGLEILELDRLLGILSALEMRPGGLLAGDAAPVLHPEVIAEVEADGTFSVRLSRGALPTVKIDPVAEELLASDGLDKEARGYLKNKVEEARWVTDAVAMRGATLLRVAEATLRRQRNFLTEGATGLRPLSMGEVAEELGLAASTVSRSVAGKSVQTPFGIVPLRSLFQSAPGDGGAGQASAGGGASGAVLERVRQLIDAEDKAAPLSDEAIVEALKESGVQVARRTVAKYR